MTEFVFEVPSGAWADIVDRRLLLALSGLVYAAAFASWMLWPSYAGFLLGFVLWGLSGALQSGTFEAYLYDLTGDDYAQVKGVAQAAASVGELAAMAAAAWLMSIGGYGLVGWTSVAVALLHTATVALLPRAARVEEAGPPAGYFAMLRSGVHEAARVPVVRRAVIVTSAMFGLTSYDEYFTLVGAEQGLTASQVPWLAALMVVGYSVGTLCAGVTARWPSSRVASMFALGAVVLSLGVLAGGWGGYVALAVGFGMLSNGYLVGEARLQDVIEGEARATVTSVWGLGTEVWAIAAFAAVGLGSAWWSLPVVVAAAGIPLTATAAIARRWLPEPAGSAEEEGVHPDVRPA